MTPAPDRTESLPGYLLRLSEANGYPSNYLLGELMGRQDPSKVGLMNALPLVERAGLTAEQAARLSLRGPTTRSKATLTLLGHLLTTSDCRMGRPQVCPQCLAQTGRCEALWDLALVVACPLHGTPLLERCEACGDRLRWSRLKIALCRCGADLREQGRARAADTDAAKLAAMFRSALYGIQSYPLPAGLDHLAHLDLHGLGTLVWVLAGEVAARDGHPGRHRARTAFTDQLGDVMRALSNWPANFRAFLRETYAPRLTQGALVPTYRSVFGWAQIRLGTNLRERAIGTRFLRREVRQFAGQYWTRDRVGRRAEDDDTLPEQLPWGTLAEAAGITGIQIGTLRKKINAGEVPIRRCADTREQRCVMVSLDWARGRVRTQHAALGLRAAARHIGLPIDTLRHLRADGVYRIHHQTDVASCYSVEDLDALREQLLATAPRRLARLPADGVVLGTWLREPRPTLLKLGLLKALLAGDARPKGRVGSDINGMILDRLGLEMFVEGLTGPRPACVSQGAAAKTLGTSVETIRGLLDYGYLQSVYSRGRRSVDPTSVQGFARKYQLLSVLAGSRARWVAATAADARIRLVELQLTSRRTWLVPSTSLKPIQRLLRRS